MSTTTHPTPDELEALHQRLCDARILSETYEILMYGAERGLIAIDEVKTDWETIKRLTYWSVAQAAWQVDQQARSVPLECPSWCDGKHGSEWDSLSSVLCPFDQVASHSAELARCQLPGGKSYSVDLVREQTHPESRDQGREFVAIFGGGDEAVEVEPGEFDQVAESMVSMLTAARRRLAEIRGPE
jgi:hypothetical protein